MLLIVHPLCISVQRLDRRVRLYRERGWYSESPATGSVSLPLAVMFPQPAPVRRTSNKTFPLLPSCSMASISVGTPRMRASQPMTVALDSQSQANVLQEHFVAAELDLVGLQECRTPALQTRQMQHYFRVSSGACTECCGCELWVRNTLHVSSKSISVFAHSPRLLAVVTRSNPVSADVIVTYAPCEETPDAPQHWQMLRRLIAVRAGRAIAHVCRRQRHHWVRDLLCFGAHSC